MRKICLIVGAADFSGMLPSICKEDMVIAADAGYKTLERLGVKADWVVGDFDSLGAPPHIRNVQIHPAEKDDTDMMLAVTTGLKAGYRLFFIYGGLGGRLDHTLANLQTLLFIRRAGARGWMIDDQNAVTAIENETLSFSPDAKGVISVFAADGTAAGVTLSGLKYPLTDHTLLSDVPLGVSNEFIGKSSAVYVKKGALLLVAPPDAPSWCAD